MSNLKQEILELLDREQFISGQKIADHLNVSRTAVWKTIQSLRAEGYTIESLTNKGYHLKNAPGLVSRTALSVLVGRSSIFNSLEYYPTTESTQKDAFRLLAGRDDAYIVVAEEQTKGRGRFERRWDSPDKSGLYISIVLRPNISITEIIRFNLFISLAISKSIDEAFGIETGIKWPNDIYIGSRKTCGFLTEVVSESNVINAIICGIGINIFKDERLKDIPNAISIEEEMDPGDKLDIDLFLERFFHNIEDYYTKFLTGAFQEVRDEWKERAIIFGKTIRISETGRRYMAKALDITEDGFLEVLDEEGTIKKVISADVEL